MLPLHVVAAAGTTAVPDISSLVEKLRPPSLKFMPVAGACSWHP